MVNLLDFDEAGMTAFLGERGQKRFRARQTLRWIHHGLVDRVEAMTDLAKATRAALAAVYIPEDDRGTLCVSSQAGCALDCAFCSTGKQGFNRNLSAGEIIGQLWHANRTLIADGVR